MVENLATELQVDQHIVWAEKVSNKELPQYYAACDLFAMPNRVGPAGDVEGFGIVFLEAGFFEKPVIGGNSGGVPDAVQHEYTGLLVDGIKVSSIAQGILKILSDKHLSQTMGEHGRQFALSITHERVFEAYQTLMEQCEL